MISVTFESKGKYSFLLQVDVAGDGFTTTNIKMNTKWLWLAAMYSLDNDATRVVLTQPLHHSMILLLLSP
jgi:hypothetical protein